MDVNVLKVTFVQFNGNIINMILPAKIFINGI